MRLSWLPVLVAGVSCVFGFAASAAALEARLIDRRSGEPVRNASVSILGLTGTTTTDGEGRFTWAPSPTPPFDVLVVLEGGRVLRPVHIAELPAAGALEVGIEPMFEEELVVSAPVAPNIAAMPASATTLLGRREVEMRAPGNLTQALEQIPGVVQVSEGQAAVPAIRGLARGRTLILVDGARVTSERRVGPSATFLDPLILDTVEVARGPGSVAYGSDAFGGVILATTRRLAPNTPLMFKATTTLGAGIPEWRAHAELGGGWATGSLLVQAHGREADDYRSPAGDVFNSGWRDTGFVVRGEQVVGRGLFSGVWQSDFARDVERPRNNSTTVRFYYPTEDSHRATASYDLRNLAGFSRLGVTGFLGWSSVVTDQDRYATPSRVRSIERADVTGRDFHVKGFAERIIGNARLEGGVDVNGRFGLRALDVIVTYDRAGSIAAQSGNVSIDDARRVDVGAYVTADVGVQPWLMVSGGARLDQVTSRNSGGYFGDRSVSHAAASGFASATAAVGRGWSLTGQVARGFRDPTLSDRFFRGPSGRGFITGNPDLQPETSLQYDGALRYTAGRLRVGVFGYHYRISDLIERYQTVTDFFFFRNSGRARIRGVEVESSATLGRWTTVSASVQRSRGELLGDGTAIDDIGADSISAQIQQQFSARVNVSLRAAAYGRDSRPGPSEIETPGYVRVDASTNVRLSKHLELQGAVRNLLDREYFASPDPRTVLAAGVSGSVTAVVAF